MLAKMSILIWLFEILVIVSSVQGFLFPSYCHHPEDNITSHGYPEPSKTQRKDIYNICVRKFDTSKYLVAYFEVFHIAANHVNASATTLQVQDGGDRVIGIYTTWVPPGLVTEAQRIKHTLRITFNGQANVAVLFKIHFKTMHEDEIVGNTEISSSSFGEFHSPGYPLNYPINSEFRYVITTPIKGGVVQFYFEDMQLGLGAEVFVYDASANDQTGQPFLLYNFKEKQGKSWHYYLGGNVMTLVFKTGIGITDKGFNITFTEYCTIAGQELPCRLIEHSEWMNVIIFVISMFGAIIVVVILIRCGILCARSRALL